MANELTPEIKKQTLAFVKDMELEFNRALPKHISKERFLRIVQTEFSKNPKLFMCERVSLLGSIMFAAQLGLEIGSHLGHCYLIPYYSNRDKKLYCTIQYGYKGLLELVRRSGQVSAIIVENIYEKDKFKMDKFNNKIEFDPCLEDDRGKHILTVAQCTFKDGTKHIEYMTYSQIQKRRKIAKSDDIWKQWEERMAEKTVLKAMCRLLPISIEDQRIISMDDRVIKTASNENKSIIDDSDSIDYNLELPEIEETKQVENKEKEEVKEAKEAKEVKVETVSPNPLNKNENKSDDSELFGN